MAKRWGQSGYPEIVPKSNWAAVSVVTMDGQPLMTDIYPFMDDPLFQFRTVQNSPHLTASQREAINLPHRKEYWGKEGRTFAADIAADIARDDAFDLLRVEHLLRHRFENPRSPYEDDVGGWLPLGGDTNGLSQTGIDLAERQMAKALKDYDLADLIRRVVVGGGVEVMDFPSGTLWKFASARSARRATRAC